MYWYSQCVCQCGQGSANWVWTNWNRLFLSSKTIRIHKYYTKCNSLEYNKSILKIFELTNGLRKYQVNRNHSQHNNVFFKFERRSFKPSVDINKLAMFSLFFHWIFWIQMTIFFVSFKKLKRLYQIYCSSKYSYLL